MARRVAASSGASGFAGASGISGSGGEPAGGEQSGGSIGACDANPPKIPVSPAVADGPTRCSGWAARRSFGHALCACGDLDVPDVLATDTVDSRNTEDDSLDGGAAVGVNGTYSGGHYVRVAGSLTIAGDGTLSSAGGIQVEGDLRLRGAASAAGPILIGRDAWLLDGVETLSYANVGRDLLLAANGGLTATGLATVGGRRVNGAFDISPPCACSPEEVLQIAGTVNDVVTANDNQRIDLGLDALTDVRTPTDVTLTCGRYALHRISGTARISLRVSGRAVLAVAGDVALPSGSSIILEPNAQLDWFISGNLELGAIARIGSIERTAAVRVYVLGSGEIALAGTPAVAMNLYAPHADVTVGVAGNVYGAVVAKNVESSGLLFIHYDRAVTRADEDCPEERPQSCTSCDLCGAGRGCVAGVCSACTMDSDCCFPLVCRDGACETLP